MFEGTVSVENEPKERESGRGERVQVLSVVLFDAGKEEHDGEGSEDYRVDEAIYHNENTSLDGDKIRMEWPKTYQQKQR